MVIHVFIYVKETLENRTFFSIAINNLIYLDILASEMNVKRFSHKPSKRKETKQIS